MHSTPMRLDPVPSTKYVIYKIGDIVCVKLHHCTSKSTEEKVTGIVSLLSVLVDNMLLHGKDLQFLIFLSSFFNNLLFWFHTPPKGMRFFLIYLLLLLQNFTCQFFKYVYYI